MNKNTSTKKLLTLGIMFCFLCLATGCSFRSNNTTTPEETITSTEDRIEDYGTSEYDETDSEGILGDLIDDVSEGIENMDDNLSEDLSDDMHESTSDNISDNMSEEMHDDMENY